MKRKRAARKIEDNPISGTFDWRAVESKLLERTVFCLPGSSSMRKIAEPVLSAVHTVHYMARIEVSTRCYESSED